MTAAENNSSVILLAQVDGKKLLFTGDAEHPAPQLFTRLRAQGVRTITVLGGQEVAPLVNFAMAVGYAPVEGTDQQQPFRLWTRRYALLAAPLDSELPPPPPGDTLPPLDR